jgi:hypothetical protein
VRVKKELSFLGFSFLCCLPFNCKIPPPHFGVCWRQLFIGKMLFGPQNWSLNFHFFFCKFWFFLIFLYFFENEQHQRRFNEKNQLF